MSDTMRQPKLDRESPAYKHAVATCLRWDKARDEPYLQLPSFPDLRLTPYRPGIAEDLKMLFNHPDVGKRLYSLPYPMDLAFAEKMESDFLASQAPLLARLRMSLSAPLPEKDAESTPVLAAYGVPAILGYPFKSLRSVSENRVVGDMYVGPNTDEPIWDATSTGEAKESKEGEGEKDGAGEKKQAITDDDVRALPLDQQSWMLGYVLEPAQYGRGVMGEALACILEGWVRPFMRVGEVAAFIEVDNPGSVGVAVRNGLVWRREERSVWPEAKGGGVHVNGYYTRDLR